MNKMCQENNSSLSLRLRSPSDCDEHVFSSDVPGNLQLIPPKDLLEMSDDEFSLYVETNKRSLAPRAPALKRQRNHDWSLFLDADADADAIYPEWSLEFNDAYKVFNEPQKVDIRNFEITRWKCLNNPQH